MKNMKSTVVRTLSALGLVFLMAACGKIPSAYQGTFHDAKAGVTITLSSGSGDFKTASGRELKSKAQSLDFNLLKKGQQGLYVSQNPTNKNLLDIFWLNPDVASRQQSYGLVWFKSEVFYTIMNSKEKGKVAGISMFHCLDGTVMVDLVKKRMQMGCPAGPQAIRAIRVTKNNNNSSSVQQVTKAIVRD